MLEIIYIFACKCCVNNVCTMSEELALQDIERHRGAPPLIPNKLFFEVIPRIANKLSFSDICGLATIPL
jgi:hypothetical protein